MRTTERVAVSPQEAADRLGVSRAFIYVLLNRGELTGHKIGRVMRISIAELDRLVGIEPEGGES